MTIGSPCQCRGYARFQEFTGKAQRWPTEDNPNSFVAIAKDITVQLDAGGQATISPGDIDNGSYGCSGIPDLSLDITTFDCSDVGAPVTVTLTAIQGNETSTATALVTIEAAGNCESVFTIDAIADVTIDENTAYTSVIPTITGSPVGTLTYSLDGVDAALFTLNPSIGQVSMVARDFEAPADANADNVYEITLTATDADANSASEAWRVTIQDVPETVTFAIDAIADVTIDENTAYTSVTPTITGLPVGTLTYSLGGVDAGLFTLDANTGQVSMEARDFEAPADANADNVYEVTLTATDADANSASEAWSVTIQDVLETATFAIDAIDDVTIDENTAYTSVTPTITGSPIGTLTYTLGGVDAGLFTLDANTGQVSMVARDFEAPADANADNVYEIILTATDVDANSASEAWRVTIQDVPETATFAIDAIADVTIDENTAYTSVIPSIMGSVVGTLTYSLGGADAGLFTLDANTGQVSMVARDFEAPVDANADNVYEITLTATDANANSASEAWRVTIQDVPETVTFAIDAIADVTIDENTAYTSVIPSITGSPIGTVTYTLGGVDAGLFTLDANTGQVSMVARDFEAPVDANADNVYEITLTATDADANSAASVRWSVTIQDFIGDNMSIATAFTPNGDGVNDTWIIDNLSDNSSVTIFSRDQEVIFSIQGIYCPMGWHLQK